MLQLLYQTTPWAISKSYISYRNSLSTNRTQNLVALEMFGPGDPTGRGLAYSFVRQRARVSWTSLHWPLLCILVDLVPPGDASGFNIEA